MKAARWLLTAAFAGLTGPFVGLLVLAAHRPYHDLQQTYATAIGLAGLLVFGLPTLILTRWSSTAGPRSLAQSLESMGMAARPEPEIDEAALDEKWAKLCGE